MSKLMSGPIGKPPVLPNGARIPLSPAYAADNLIFLSGQLGFDANTKIVDGGISAQTTQCLSNIEQLLSDNGAAKRDIIKATVWLVRKEDFAAFNQAYSEFFGDHLPARSCVCSELLVEGALVEIEVVAPVKD